jgi:lycopene cyclase domain-containing protein
MIVNGILTGSLIEKEVVWYNPDEILGLRVLTIPAEDFVYGFSLILFNLLVINLLNHGKPLYEF